MIRPILRLAAVTALACALIPAAPADAATVIDQHPANPYANNPANWEGLYGGGFTCTKDGAPATPWTVPAGVKFAVVKAGTSDYANVVYARLTDGDRLDHPTGLAIEHVIACTPLPEPTPTPTPTPSAVPDPTPTEAPQATQEPVTAPTQAVTQSMEDKYMADTLTATPTPTDTFRASSTFAVKSPTATVAVVGLPSTGA